MTEPSLEPDKIKSIVEAVLLTAEAPVTPGRLVALFDGLTGRDIRTAIDALKSQYAENDHAFTIIEVAGGFQLVTQPQYSPWLRKFHQDRHQVRLSQAALESLSIIAFKQPITRIQVDSIRGVNSSGVINTLMELNLIRMVGRSDGIGKPMLFGTTRDFLVHFGLKTLADLPKAKELEELLADGDGSEAQLPLGLDNAEAGAAEGDEAAAGPDTAAPAAEGEVSDAPVKNPAEAAPGVEGEASDAPAENEAAPAEEGDESPTDHAPTENDDDEPASSPPTESDGDDLDQLARDEASEAADDDFDQAPEDEAPEADAPIDQATGDDSPETAPSPDQQPEETQDEADDEAPLSP